MVFLFLIQAYKYIIKFIIYFGYRNVFVKLLYTSFTQYHKRLKHTFPLQSTSLLLYILSQFSSARRFKVSKIGLCNQRFIYFFNQDIADTQLRLTILGQTWLTFLILLSQSYLSTIQVARLWPNSTQIKDQINSLSYRYKSERLH